MVRRSSSFFISLFIHVAVIALVIFLYNYISNAPKRVSMNLSKCTFNCGCGMGETEKKPKEVLQPQAHPKQKQEKKVVKKEEKKVVKKSEPKKEVVKKEIQPEPKKVIATNEVKESVQTASVDVKTDEKPHEEQKESSSELSQVSEQKGVDDSLEDAKRQNERQVAMQKRYINENLSKIARMLRENLYYPLRARQRGLQGDVVVKFTLLKNSDIKEIMVVKHSYDILDASAVKTIENLRGKLPAPLEDLVLEVPIKYQLH